MQTLIHFFDALLDDRQYLTPIEHVRRGLTTLAEREDIIQHIDLYQPGISGYLRWCSTRDSNPPSVTPASDETIRRADLRADVGERGLPLLVPYASANAWNSVIRSDLPYRIVGNQVLAPLRLRAEKDALSLMVISLRAEDRTALANSTINIWLPTLLSQFVIVLHHQMLVASQHVETELGYQLRDVSRIEQYSAVLHSLPLLKSQALAIYSQKHIQSPQQASPIASNRGFERVPKSLIRALVTYVRSMDAQMQTPLHILQPQDDAPRSSQDARFSVEAALDSHDWFRASIYPMHTASDVHYLLFFAQEAVVNYPIHYDEFLLTLTQLLSQSLERVDMFSREPIVLGESTAAGMIISQMQAQPDIHSMTQVMMETIGRTIGARQSRIRLNLQPKLGAVSSRDKEGK